MTRTGTGIVRGRQASWLRIAPPKTRGRGDHWVDYVAVDEKSGKPLRVEARDGKHVYGYDIDVIAQTTSLPTYIVPSKQFGRLPVPMLTPGRRHGRGAHEVSLAQVTRLIPGALWAGNSVAGMRFRRARVIALDDGENQLELLYGGPCPSHCVLIKQGVEAGWAPGSPLYKALPDETAFVGGGRYADGRAGHLIFRLEGTGRAAILATALALRPLAP